MTNARPTARAAFKEKWPALRSIVLGTACALCVDTAAHAQKVVCIKKGLSSLSADIGVIDSQFADVVIGLVDSTMVDTLISITDKPERADIVLVADQISRKADATVKICSSQLAKKTVSVRKTPLAHKTVCVREKAAGADIVVCVTDPELLTDFTSIVVACEVLGLLK